jgi:hypothetical protein
MGRTAFEMALLGAGVGVSIALAAELSEVWADEGDTVEDGQAPAFALQLLERWELDVRRPRGRLAFAGGRRRRRCGWRPWRSLRPAGRLMPPAATEAAGRAPASARRIDPTPWLAIEPATNGYLIQDSAAGEVWLIADDDWFEAAAELLAEINGRLGNVGDGYDERRVTVNVEPGDRWLAFNSDECLHDRVLNPSYGASGLWSCSCGLEFIPAPRSARGEAAA